jgi:hypothetical protein
VRQTRLLQRAGKTETVHETEGESEHPAAAYLTPRPRAPQIFDADEDDGRRDDGLDDAARGADDIQRRGDVNSPCASVTVRLPRFYLL